MLFASKSAHRFLKTRQQTPVPLNTRFSPTQREDHYCSMKSLSRLAVLSNPVHQAPQELVPTTHIASKELLALSHKTRNQRQGALGKWRK